MKQLIVIIILFCNVQHLFAQRIAVDSLIYTYSEYEFEDFIKDSLEQYPEQYNIVKSAFLKRVAHGNSITPKTIRTFSTLYTRKIGSLECVPFLNKLRTLLDTQAESEALLLAIISEKVKISEYHYPSFDDFDFTMMDFYSSRKYFYEQFILFQEMNYYMGRYLIKHDEFLKGESALHDVFEVHYVKIRIGDMPSNQPDNRMSKKMYALQQKAFIQLAKLYAEHQDKFDDIDYKFAVLKFPVFRSIYTSQEVMPIFNEYLKKAGQETIPSFVN